MFAFAMMKLKSLLFGLSFKNGKHRYLSREDVLRVLEIYVK